MSGTLGIRPPYGISSFAQLRRGGYLYVDKTGFIRVIEERPEPFLLYLRPRRFGKSLWLSVLRHYYDVNLSDQFNELFAGLEIGEAPTPERSSYRVLELDFSGVAADSSEKAAESMRLKVLESVLTFLEENQQADKEERKGLRALPSAANVLDAGLRLARRASKPVYVLIDEYDHFTNELLSHSSKDFTSSVERGGFVRKFFEVLKEGTKTIVQRIFMTGVTPVTLDSLTSGFNIASNRTLTRELHDLMGFTHDEVRALLEGGSGLDEASRRAMFSELEQWYDGYRFAPEGQRLFNPDMVLYYLANRGADGSPPDEMLDTNVASDHRTIDRTVRLQGEIGLSLLDEATERGRLSAKLTRQYSVTRGFDRDDVASLLFYLGMLTIDDRELNRLRFKVPNRVIDELFWDTVRSLRSERAGFDATVAEIGDAVYELAQSGELAPLAGLVERYLEAVLSNRDLRGFRESELKIAFLMLVHAPRIYMVRSERELDRGYVDVLLLRRPGIPAPFEHALELKYLKQGASDDAVASAARDAREQLDGYLESEELQSNPRLVSWVVVFRGATCEVLERSGAPSGDVD